MTKRKEYSKCSSSTDLYVRAMQNAIIRIVYREKLLNSLETGHYLYHSTLANALADDATTNMVFHAAMEIERYSMEHYDCQGELNALFAQEIEIAIRQEGLRIHNQELLLHGRKIIKNNKT